MSDKPKFSIVVPTRNRPEYLYDCLLTCVKQDNAEVVVSDNSSDDVAIVNLEVLNKIGCSNVKYVRSPDVPLAMTANWNFGVSKATGDYVTVVGDDDGLLPFCTRSCAKLIDETGALVINWPWASYYWPRFRDENFRNIVYFKPPSIHRTLRYAILDGREVVRKVIHNKAPHDTLPMLYNSFVHKSVLERMVSSDGMYVDAISPDIYSGIAVALTAGKIVRSDFPLGICGTGSKSNGSAFKSDLGTSAIAQDFRLLNKKSGLDQPLGVVDAGIFACSIMDGLNRFSKKFPHLTKEIKHDLYSLAEWQSDEVSRMNLSDELRNRYKRELLEWFSKDQKCVAIINKKFSENRFSPATVDVGLSRNWVTFDASVLGCTGIASVSDLLGHMLGEPNATFTGMSLMKRVLRKVSKLNGCFSRA